MALAQWSGDAIYYTTLSHLYAARIETEPTFRVRSHEELLPLPPGVTAANYVGWYDVAPDSERFLMARPNQFSNESDVDPIQLILVQNFFEELKARVPN